jgi:hypothetical protein
MKVAPKQLSLFLVNGGDTPIDAVRDRKRRNFEHEIRHILKAHGFSVVRGASSGEFFGDMVDLIADKGGATEPVYRH